MPAFAWPFRLRFSGFGGHFFRLRGKNGGGERDRTDDPLRARQVLSQLSYTPVKPITDYELRIRNRIQKPIRNS